MNDKTNPRDAAINAYRQREAEAAGLRISKRTFSDNKRATKRPT